MIPVDQIRFVQELRERVAIERKREADLLAAWGVEHQALLDSLVLDIAALAGAEKALRDSAVAEYQATGNKAPAPGVAIRMMLRLDYELKEAYDWAEEHKMALKLDVYAFEKVAKASPLAFDFVVITQEPHALIATDLSKALGEGD